MSGRALAVLLLIGSRLAAATGDAGCLVCHSSRELAVIEPDGQVRSRYVDANRFASSVHGKRGCLECHAGFGVGPHGDPPVADLPEPWPDILRERSLAARSAVANCVRCHRSQAADYVQSVHAQTAATGDQQVPLCQDCHGSHYITPHDELESSTNPANVPATCARCHADSTVMASFNAQTNVVQTFETSFHGEKSALGSREAAVCTSCHGTHDIRRHEDPLSRVNPARVAVTCGQPSCHPGAGPQFAQAFSHQVPTTATAPVVFWVSWFYRLAIVGTIGGMLGYMLLDFRRRRLNPPGSHA
ncbi:MAG: hypothetical protein IT204_14640 [Fimbriimonadaceae bacterium]|nr:hypothetical protein [Fimbriimonadaceae bacterium]